MPKISDNDFPHLDLVEGAAPATPSSGLVRVYTKTDGLLYYKDDTGAETSMAGRDTGWHYVGAGGGEPAFQNSWVNYGSWGNAAFRRIGNIVYLAGLVMSGNGSATIFTLPTGYRIESITGGSTARIFVSLATTVARIDVYTNGNVAGNGVNNAWCSLDPIRFPTADAWPT